MKSPIKIMWWTGVFIFSSCLLSVVSGVERGGGEAMGKTVPQNARSFKIRKDNIRKTEKIANVAKSILTIGFLNTNGLSDTSLDDLRRAVVSKDLDVLGLVETKYRQEEWHKRIEIQGYECHEVRRSSANGDRAGGGIAVLTRKKSGLVFKPYSPTISSEQLAYVNNERLWLTYGSGTGRTAICVLYLGFQDSTDRHGQWNDGIFAVLEEEIFEFHPSTKQPAFCSAFFSQSLVENRFKFFVHF